MKKVMQMIKYINR